MTINSLLKTLSEKLEASKRCLFFHRWTKWEFYEERMFMRDLCGSRVPNSEFIMHIQKRHCLDCGYNQKEEIKI